MDAVFKGSAVAALIEMKSQGEALEYFKLTSSFSKLMLARRAFVAFSS